MASRPLHARLTRAVRNAFAAQFRWLGRHPFVPGCVGTLVGIAIVALAFTGFAQQREQALTNARQTSGMLVSLVASHLESNFGVYDLILTDALESIRDPRTATLPRDLRRKLIFGKVASSTYLDGALYVDAHGQIVESADGRDYPNINLADRDYFRAQQRSRSVGMYISDPFRSRVNEGQYAIGLSRRVNDYDGAFGGVVLLTLRLAYFQQLFDRIDAGRHGAVFIMLDDGTLLARKPYSDYDVGTNLASQQQVAPMLKSSEGTFIARDDEDGTTRIYTWRRVPHSSLIVAVAPALDDTLAAWHHRVALNGPMSLVFGVVVALSSWLLAFGLRARLRAESELQRLSVTDALTGLANRRALDLRLVNEWNRARRAEEPLSILFIDIDRFKLFNDFYGHAVGDEVLAAVAHAIEATVHRATDMAARYGGEEFAVVLSNTPPDGALTIAEQIRANVQRLGIAHGHSEHGSVTVSVGGATCTPRESTGAHALLRAADEALYAAKQAGRNQVKATAFDGPPPDPRNALVESEPPARPPEASSTTAPDRR
ncbi:sensor domain-containing diguanylate cyclase [Paraburkholderia pallida]|uniref:diguanylate cyclase n=1 Tax=Paraburkholderia pallida TaxID=2547399 RepID=A0A4P7CTR6_9BURK|nr:diguanylate cyclase [Paraburkholderia pallida]QBQ99400.1 sensor domain-containing diguanylate cyclase [Paraburkholderia pallida]